MTTAARIVVLISGSGSNLQTLIDACAEKKIDAEIAAVISNRADAYGLQRASAAGIETVVIEHGRYTSRELFDQQLETVITSYAPRLIVLAGFMRILSEAFVQQFTGRMLNIHPSLLPNYPGLHTHQRAIDAKDPEAGATVHFVTPELDAGPAIIQARVPVLEDDSAESLASRILREEHKIYPLAVRWYIEGKVCLSNGVAMLDDKPLAECGWQYSESAS